jgi:Spy/CpxP family protein refolding chaperone
LKQEDPMDTMQSEPKPARKARSPWLLALVVTGAAFLFGVVVGAVLTHGFLFRRTMHEFGPPGFRTDVAVKKIRKDLDLSDEQAGKLEKLFKEHADNMKAIHEDVRPRVEAELESFRSKVEAILTPGQAKRWNEKFRSKLSEMLPPHPPGPHGMHAPQPPGPKGPLPPPPPP